MIYFIMTMPLPTAKGHIPVWWEMKFVNVNGCPVPFKSEADARDYMKAWKMEEPEYTIWKVEKLS